ncbi:DJ-1/PfpI family protein [Sphaerisporangium sp. NPDC051017]|uniref:DJ-1/PfpI family protein n=1 Tax=Sphaerisporangium sp. NPDC051017 TaxID=3154636 RepID=UPI0034198FE4
MPPSTRKPPGVLRRAGRVLPAVLLTAATLSGICAAGVATAMAQSYAGAGEGMPAAPPAPKAIPKGKISVAVVVSGAGSVTADVLAPYEVFSRSERFVVYTVAARRVPAPLSGGLRLLPDHTLDEVDSGAIPEPDVVVVPAVVDPAGAAEAPLRAWITARARHGARVLGVCAGSALLAATGVLDGRQATSFWANIDGLRADYPRVHWLRGERYVEDGEITTTAGITSGTVGALRLVERLAGAAEAGRIGAELRYPGWTLDGPTAITANRLVPSDLPYALNAAFPWLRPTVGVGLSDGVGEIDVAAAFEVYSGVSFSARAIPVGAKETVTTRHGVVLVTEPAGEAVPALDRLLIPGTDAAGVAGGTPRAGEAGGAAGPGTGTGGQADPVLARWASGRGLVPETPGGGRRAAEFGFDPVLRDLARHADRATARITAKFSEYPIDGLRLEGPAWPWRSTILLAAALAASVFVGLTPTLVRRVRSSRARDRRAAG